MKTSQILAIARKQIALTSETIYVSKSHGTVQFFKTDQSGQKIYLKKKNIGEIKILAQKKYSQMVISALSKTEPGEKSLAEIYRKFPNELKPYISPFELPLEDKIKLWIAEKYIRKTVDDISVSYLTDKGDQVRSKSEVIIANKLYQKEIPYRYECKLSFADGIVLYPDFTIMHPKTGKIILFEHFGKMDTKAYAEYFVRKINTYEKNGFFLGDNLICTFETSEIPISITNLDIIINRFLS